MTKFHVVLPTALNVRAAPNATSDSTILGVLSLGTVIEELDADADRSWLRVRVGTLEGWASNKYLLDDRAYQSFPWMAHAVGEFGVAEVPGAKVNRRIEAYLAAGGASGANDDTTAWCSGFAKWCVLQARAGNKHIPDMKNINLAARSWFLQGWGADVTTSAPLGSVVVLWRRRGSNEPGATAADRNGTPEQVKTQGTGGHVGFLAAPYKAGDADIELLGGNQGNKVSKQRYSHGTGYGLLGMRGLQ